MCALLKGNWEKTQLVVKVLSLTSKPERGNLLH